MLLEVCFVVHNEFTVVYEEGDALKRSDVQAAVAATIEINGTVNICVATVGGGSFKPLLMHHVTANSRVGVIGIGGLGHIAIKLLHAMGAEVTAFSSNPAKEQEVLAMGADRVVNSRDPEALKALAGQFDLIINTVAVDLDWQPYFEALAYGGNFHTVGAVMKPFPVPAFTLIGGDRSISGSATGNPAELRKLMKFAGRSKVAPTTVLFPMSQINEALKHVREGKARYRVVLKADF